MAEAENGALGRVLHQHREDQLDAFAQRVRSLLEDALDTYDPSVEGEEIRGNVLNGVAALFHCHQCGHVGVPPCCDDGFSRVAGARPMTTEKDAVCGGCQDDPEVPPALLDRLRALADSWESAAFSQRFGRKLRNVILRPACTVDCGHPAAHHDDRGACQHLCDRAWPAATSQSGGGDG